MISLAASIGLPFRARGHSPKVFFGAANFGPGIAGPKNRKSSVNEELSQGVCRPSVDLFTANRTRLKVSSMGIPDSLPALSSALVYGLLAPLPSSATAPGDVENDRNVPGAPILASTMARPPPEVLLMSGNGLLRQALRHRNAPL